MKVNKLALAIGIAFTTLAAAPSYALLISTSVKASTSVSINGTTNADSISSSTYALSESGLNTESPVRANASASAYGKDTGESGLKSYGSPFLDRSFLSTNLDLSSNASVLHTATITNDTGTGQNIDFSFLILSGELGLGYSDTYSDGSTLIQSGYSADIRVNGTSLWDSSASLTAVNDWWNGQSLTTNGTTLGALSGDGVTYQWGSYAGVLNLGYLAAGASLTLEYQLNTYVNQYLADAGYAHTPEARFDDPFGFGSTPIFDASNFVTTSSGAPSTVPEPANTLLLGAGLAALAFRRRKARKTAV
ncbi:PEP-CTERM sorting domain-containing protein [Cellvibrio sp. OA-2007]|uniref:PEP-CTERM sorting domain-containing protein n=1 Tax=Cellvibrio sp. OA-2007 TaxID=529823 RepID=UPI000780BFFD|nr:PEP-CTERM sorting domain-containing protein [Cellvibrio sp. OA-2007]